MEDHRDQLVRLDRDHPGFRDPDYRRRRDDIARLALEYHEGDPVPLIPYTEEEHETWGVVWEHLVPLHQRLGAREVREALREAALPTDRIPQLRDVNQLLCRTSGYRMWPVAGLVEGSVFLSYLAQDVFLSTQYVRHHSRPLYTPEPDVIHELVGHGVTLAHPLFAQLNRAFGAAATYATPERATALLRVYWYTLEFGLVREGAEVRAYGAGLLSSYGELERFQADATLRKLDLDACAGLPFDPTDYQATLFVADDMAALVRDLLAWLKG